MAPYAPESFPAYQAELLDLPPRDALSFVRRSLMVEDALRGNAELPARERLPTTELVALVALILHAGDDRLAFPSNEQIAAQMGACSKTAGAAIGRLVARGLVARSEGGAERRFIVRPDRNGDMRVQRIGRAHLFKILLKARDLQEGRGKNVPASPRNHLGTILAATRGEAGRIFGLEGEGPSGLRGKILDPKGEESSDKPSYLGLSDPAERETGGTRATGVRAARDIESRIVTDEAAEELSPAEERWRALVAKSTAQLQAQQQAWSDEEQQQPHRRAGGDR